MPFDLPKTPISPSLVLVLAGYACVSSFVTGPEIAIREIDRSGWQSRCETRLETELQSKAPKFVPNTPSKAELCGVFGAFAPELETFCTMLPDTNAPARAAEERVHAQKIQRLKTAMQGVDDQCRCAEAVYLEEERLPLALYAGSLRLVSPPSVKDRDGALNRALRTPFCGPHVEVNQ